jgi:tetratricopeptide (TPR) repeat protein
MSSPSSADVPYRRNRLVAGLVVLIAVAGFGLWFFVLRERPPVDMDAVLVINTRGVGHMDRFEYKEAAAAFQDAAQRAPRWLPARINLAIALLNEADADSLQQAVALFKEVLKEDPKNPHAHFCLGIIYKHQGKFAEANPYFKKVATELDREDPHAWLYYGKTLEDETKQKECYEKAIKLDPYLRPALYGLERLIILQDPDRAKALREAHSQVGNQADVGKDTAYGEVGKYATVLARPPGPPSEPLTGPVPLFRKHEEFQVKLAQGVRWATGADFEKGAAADFRRRVRDRFGATLVVLDFNGDDKLDLFLLGAVVDKGKVRDLLLRNEGDAVFTDVTKEAGLEGDRASLGCAVADFDNDGSPDIFLTGVSEQWLFRNNGKGGFENVTKEAGLNNLNSVCLGATWVDLDLDGDLDLVLARFAESAEEGLALLAGKEPKGPVPKPGRGLAVFLNVGEAPAKRPSLNPPPLKPRFRAALESEKGLASLQRTDGAPVNLALTDLDGDRDLDLVLLADGQPPIVLTNERLLRFRRAEFPEGLAPAGPWNGALLLDANHDERSDLFMCGPDQAPFFLVSQSAAGVDAAAQGFKKGITNSPPLVYAQAADLDYDGWTDVVGLSEKRKPVLLHNDGRRLVHVPDAFGNDGDWPDDLIGLTVAELAGGNHPDLLIWSEAKGLLLYRSLGNDNKALRLGFVGQRREGEIGTKMWSNAEGLGIWAMAQAASFWTGAENATLSAGLGRSRQPLALGLGKRAAADVVRLRWPDNCWQAEFDVVAGPIRWIEEINRKRDSCPLLFTWNGRRYEYIGDFLGAGSIGETLPDGTCRPPRPEESVKIEATQLIPLNGDYVLKIAEPMNEVTYLDRLQLVVTDLPPGVRAYPDERFTGDAKGPSQDLLVFEEGKAVYPLLARDHRKRDLTQAIRRWDRETADGFAHRAWVGYAEEHWVTLDFGDRLSKFGKTDPLVLFLAGWTDYPYPHSMWAAHQAGVPLLPPVLERLDADGKWQPVVADMGFPAGTPRMMTLDVTGKLGGPSCVLRIRTNMHVFWDQVFIAPLSARIAHKATERETASVRLRSLEVKRATLEARGCMLEFSPDGKAPTLYDYDRLERVPLSGFVGKLTRLGDVTELLQGRDDCFVIFGPGEEVDVRFDARALPPLPEGWTRSFVLRSWGYCKGAGPFTATGGRIEPLPFQAMSRFPYGSGEHYPRTPRHEEYRRTYNTRQVGP